MKKTLAIIGAGRFGSLARNLALETREYESFIFFDDYRSVGEGGIVGQIDDVERFYREQKFDALTIAIGYQHWEFRQSVYERFEGAIPFATLIHPSAFVSNEAILGSGVSIYSMVNVEAGSCLGSNVTIFNQTSITHDVHVGDHSFFSVGIGMGGGVHFGKRVFVGVNASIVNDISIGDDSIVCGGTFLTESISNDCCVIGNPFKYIEKVDL